MCSGCSVTKVPEVYLEPPQQDGGFCDTKNSILDDAGVMYTPLVVLKRFNESENLFSYVAGSKPVVLPKLGSFKYASKICINFKCVINIILNLETVILKNTS